MNKNLPWSFFFYFMVFLIFLSTNSWFMLWVSMEMNTILFLSLMKNDSNSTQEKTMSYFLVQAISSILLLFSIFNIQTNNMESIFFLKNILLFLLFLKMGGMPMHFWAFSLISLLPLMASFLFFTMQKMMPLIILMISINSNFMLFFLIFLGAAFSPIMNNTQNNLMKMLFLSGSSHLSWMVLSTSISQELTLFYFFTYTLIMSFIMLSTQTNIYTMFLTNNKPNFFFFFTMMSLAGLPLSLGFYPKINVLLCIQQNNMFLLILPLIFGSFFDFWVYTRFSYSCLLLKMSSLKWSFSKKNNNLNCVFFFYLFTLIYIIF